MRNQTYIIPKCKNCGMNIYGLCVEQSNFEIAPPLTIRIIKRLEPSTCPNCNLIFNKVEVNTDENTVIVGD